MQNVSQPQQDEKTTQFLPTGDTIDTSLSSSVWSLLPDSSKSDVMSTERAGITSLTDAAAVYGQNPYYNTGYAAAATGYGVYGSTPASYYQQVASGLRASTAAAAAFPYTIGAAAQTAAYYGSSYPSSLSFNDYSTAYNSQYYNGIRNAGYYGNLATGTSYAGTSLTADTAPDLSGFALKDKKVKSAKKKKSGSCSPADAQFVRVFVWELDDICMLSNNSLNRLAQKTPQVSRAGLLLKQVASRISGLSFAMDQMEEFDLCNVEDAAMEDNNMNDGSMVDGRGGVETVRRVAGKYFSLRQLYQEFACKAEPGCNFDLVDRCGMSSQKDEVVQAIQQVEMASYSRGDAARRCLDLVAQRSASSIGDKYANVVVCSDGLVTAVAQLLLAGLASSVPIENIYSCTKTSKKEVLEKITVRFGKKCSYVVVTSNHETDRAARAVSPDKIPVWPAMQQDSLDKLYAAQSQYLLGNN